jgi:hypothetical protein
MPAALTASRSFFDVLLVPLLADAGDVSAVVASAKPQVSVSALTAHRLPLEFRVTKTSQWAARIFLAARLTAT